MTDDDNYFEDTNDYEIPDFYSDEYVPSQDPDVSVETYNTPKKIYDFLDMHVYGHAEYKKAVSVFLWKAVQGHKPSGALLVAGNSGTGKTELFRVLKNIYSNISIADGASMVSAGYKGNNHLTSQMSNLDFTSELPPIYVIDEFDKLLHKGKRGWSETGLLGELLKCLEGERVNIGTTDRPQWVDTCKICFVLLGSFSALTDRQISRPIGFNTPIETNSQRSKLTKEMILSELTPELQGRISQILTLDEFTAEDYYKILKNPNFSPISRIENEFGVHFNVSRKKYREIANKAFSDQTGVRSMNNAICQHLDKQLFANPEIKEITIS